MKAEGTDLYFHKIFQIWTFLWKVLVHLFYLLKCFPHTFKLLKKNLINARNHLENMISGWKQKAQKTSPVTFTKYNNIIFVCMTATFLKMCLIWVIPLSTPPKYINFLCPSPSINRCLQCRYCNTQSNISPISTPEWKHPMEIKLMLIPLSWLLQHI